MGRDDDVHARAAGVQRGAILSTPTSRDDDVCDEAADVQRGATNTTP